MRYVKWNLFDVAVVCTSPWVCIEWWNAIRLFVHFYEIPRTGVSTGVNVVQNLTAR